MPEYVVQNGRSVACRLRCRAAATALAGALLEGYKAALAQHNPLHGVFGRCPFGLTVGRSVAQPGSALASGARGREFESPRSDQFPAKFLIGPSQPLPAYMKPPTLVRVLALQDVAPAGDVMRAVRCKPSHSTVRLGANLLQTHTSFRIDCGAGCARQGLNNDAARTSYLRISPDKPDCLYADNMFLCEATNAPLSAG